MSSGAGVTVASVIVNIAPATGTGTSSMTSTAATTASAALASTTATPTTNATRSIAANISNGNNNGGLGWRVKLYRLNADGSWDDCGTGRICCRYSASEYSSPFKCDSDSTSKIQLSSERRVQGKQRLAYLGEQSDTPEVSEQGDVSHLESEDLSEEVLYRKLNNPILCMHAETTLSQQQQNQEAVNTGKLLLNTRVLLQDVYQRQGENIITWCEPFFGGSEDGSSKDLDVAGHNAGVDLALSFQDNAGCLDIWSQISVIQTRAMEVVQQYHSSAVRNRPVGEIAAGTVSGSGSKKSLVAASGVVVGGRRGKDGDNVLKSGVAESAQPDVTASISDNGYPLANTSGNEMAASCAGTACSGADRSVLGTLHDNKDSESAVGKVTARVHATNTATMGRVSASKEELRDSGLQVDERPASAQGQTDIANNAAAAAVSMAAAAAAAYSPSGSRFVSGGMLDQQGSSHRLSRVLGDGDAVISGDEHDKDVGDVENQQPPVSVAAHVVLQAQAQHRSAPASCALPNPPALSNLENIADIIHAAVTCTFPPQQHALHQQHGAGTGTGSTTAANVGSQADHEGTASVDGGEGDGGGDGSGGGGGGDCSRPDGLPSLYHSQQNVVPAPPSREALGIALCDDDFAYFTKLLSLFDDLDEGAVGEIETEEKSFDASSESSPLSGSATQVEKANLRATLASIAKCILFLNEPTLLEHIVETPQLFELLCAVLEYDPELQHKANHRIYLSQMVKFRTVVQIEDESLVHNIQKCWRITFLKDTVLRPTMEEGSLTTLASLLHFAHNDVVRGVTSTASSDLNRPIHDDVGSAATSLSSSVSNVENAGMDAEGSNGGESHLRGYGISSSDAIFRNRDEPCSQPQNKYEDCYLARVLRTLGMELWYIRHGRDHARAAPIVEIAVKPQRAAINTCSDEKKLLSIPVQKQKSGLSNGDTVSSTDEVLRTKNNASTTLIRSDADLGNDHDNCLGRTQSLSTKPRNAGDELNGLSESDDKCQDTRETLTISLRGVSSCWRQHLLPQDSSLASRKVRRHGCLMFLKELFNMVRMSLQQTAKDDFYAMICLMDVTLYLPPAHGSAKENLKGNATVNLLQLLCHVIADYTGLGEGVAQEERSAALEILSAITLHDPSLIRRHVLEEHCVRPKRPDPQATRSLVSNRTLNGRRIVVLGNDAERVDVRAVGKRPAGCYALLPAADDDLLMSLITVMTLEMDAGLVLQTLEILRIVLDTDLHILDDESEDEMDECVGVGVGIGVGVEEDLMEPAGRHGIHHGHPHHLHHHHHSPAHGHNSHADAHGITMDVDVDAEHHPHGAAAAANAALHAHHTNPHSPAVAAQPEEEACWKDEHHRHATHHHHGAEYPSILASPTSEHGTGGASSNVGDENSHAESLSGSSQMLSTNATANPFLSIFYEHYVHWLAAAFQYKILTSDGYPDRIRHPEHSDVIFFKTVPGCPVRASFSLELLCFCVRAHCYRMKNFVLRSRILVHVMKLIGHNSEGIAVKNGDRCLKLAALRFLRSVVSVKDEFYHRHIVQHNLFDPVFEAFRRHPVGDDLVSSSTIEMCDFIRTENLRTLLEHIVNKFILPIPARSEQSLEELATNHVDTFTLMRQKYNENLRQKQSSGTTTGTNSGGSSSRSGVSSSSTSSEQDNADSSDPSIEGHNNKAANHGMHNGNVNRDQAATDAALSSDYYLESSSVTISSNERLSVCNLSSPKALEDQRKFRQADEEETYFNEDEDDDDVILDGDGPSLSIVEPAKKESEKDPDENDTDETLGLNSVNEMKRTRQFMGLCGDTTPTSEHVSSTQAGAYSSSAKSVEDATMSSTCESSSLASLTTGKRHGGTSQQPSPLPQQENISLAGSLQGLVQYPSSSDEDDAEVESNNSNSSADDTDSSGSSLVTNTSDVSRGEVLAMLEEEERANKRARTMMSSHSNMPRGEEGGTDGTITSSTAGGTSGERDVSGNQQQNQSLSSAGDQNPPPPT